MSNNDGFYSSPAWLKVRHKAIARAGFACQWCSTPVRGKGKAHVDHIQRRRIRPDLALDLSNLQVLCVPCHNQAKQKHEANPNMKTINANGLPADGSWD